MLKFITRTGVLILTSAIAIPYAVAFIVNLTHGWPIEEKKYKRAFHPKKVFLLNVAILKQLGQLKYLPLYLRWKKFYSTADSNRISKDIQYGASICTLDVYRPLGHSHQSGHLPVVVFVYGGTWSSGDKNMYPLLCTQLADSLQAVVCCPNYSLYPKGYVDDMVKDVVDTLRWIHAEIHHFGGDKERIMLIGHSAGAHLIAMATLELAMKQLVEDSVSMVTSVEDDVTPSMSVSRQASGIHFDDVYFNNSNGAQQFVAASTAAKDVTSGEGENVLQVSGKGSVKLESSGSSFLFLDQSKHPLERNISSDSSFLMLDASGGKLGASGDSAGSLGASLEQVQEMVERTDSDNGAPLQFDTGDLEVGVVTMDEKEILPRGKSVDDDKDDTVATRGNVEDVEDENSEDDDKTIEGVVEDTGSGTRQDLTSTALPGEASQVSLGFELLDGGEGVEGDMMSRSQREARSVLSSIRVVMGLAGVYHITDHYQFEYNRGVEDISSMARTMYGKENFDRFSPTVIVHSLPKGTRLPAFHLIHGSHDATVPVNSSTTFCTALSHMGARHVIMSQVPDCGHKEICLDLMDSRRTYHSSVMSQILTSYHKFMT